MSRVFPVKSPNKTTLLVGVKVGDSLVRIDRSSKPMRVVVAKVGRKLVHCRTAYGHGGSSYRIADGSLSSEQYASSEWVMTESEFAIATELENILVDLRAIGFVPTRTLSCETAKRILALLKKELQEGQCWG